MKNSSSFNFNNSFVSNDLWPDFINNIGISKAKLAVRQSLDLQRMQGSSFTIPVLLIDTCGAALVHSQLVKIHIGLTYVDHRMLLIYSKKLNAIQLLRDNYY